MKLVKKNITKRRRYKNRRRIIRGGTIDEAVRNLLKSLNTYEYKSIADLLETYRDDPKFQDECIRRGDRFGSILKSDCNYTKSFANFVNEMLTTAINTLRTTVDDQSKPKLTPEAIDGLYKDMTKVTIFELLDLLMKKYISAKDGPCLSVIGTQSILHSRKGRGGSKKSRRLRRKQRGGEVLTILMGVGFVITFTYIIIKLMISTWPRPLQSRRDSETPYVYRGTLQ